MSVASKYNRIAPFYEFIDLPLEFFFFHRWRKKALSDLSGKVLEVGIGTGINLKYYSPRSSVIGIDCSEKMLEKARKKASGMKNVTLFQMDAEHLEFPDRNFDYVVATFVLCSVPDYVRALQEIRRVLKLSGELIAIEYVRSNNHLISWFEDLISPITCSLIGDSMNRQTIEIIKEVGFTNLEVENLIFNSFLRQIRAKP